MLLLYFVLYDTQPCTRSSMATFFFLLLLFTAQQHLKALVYYDVFPLHFMFSHSWCKRITTLGFCISVIF